MDKNESSQFQKREIVLEWIQKSGTLETRLLEKNTGDFEYFQNGNLLILNLQERLELSLINSEQIIISLLRELEKEGKIFSAEKVTSYDTSEYHVIWKASKK